MTIQKLCKTGGYSLIAILAVSALVAAWGINQIRFGGDMHLTNEELNEFNSDIVPPSAYLLESFMEANLLAHYPEEYDDHAARLIEQKARWREHVDFWEASDIDQGLKSGLAATANNDGLRFWDEIEQNLKPAVEAGNEGRASRTLTRLLGIYRDHRKAIDDLVVATAAKQRELADSSATSVLLIGVLMSIVGLVIAAAVFGAILFMRSKVLTPLAATADTMKQMASGNLEVGRTAVHRPDEIGTMTQAIEVFREASIKQREDAEVQQEVVNTLSHALDRLAAGDLTHRVQKGRGEEHALLRKAYNQSVEQLAKLIGSVRVSAGGVNTGSSEIRAASGDLAERNERQAASLEETSAAMNQVTALVKKSAKNAAEVQSSMNETHRQATDGGVVVKKAVAAMASIEKSSEEITQIIDVIDGIAFQTNLLALNAGVEAARAGDAGKGFAVVANEVRALAQRSADSARDIKELISNSANQVGDGVSLVAETGQLLEAIVQRIGDVSGQVNVIAEMAATQASNLNHVNSTVGDLDVMTQQNAAMVEQSSAAARSLADEAQELSRLVEVFQVGNGIAAPKTVAPSSAQASVQTAPTPPAPPSPAAKSNPPASRNEPAPAPLPTSGNLALKPDFDDQDWSEF